MHTKNNYITYRCVVSHAGYYLFEAEPPLSKTTRTNRGNDRERTDNERIAQREKNKNRSDPC